MWHFDKWYFSQSNQYGFKQKNLFVETTKMPIVHCVKQKKKRNGEKNIRTANENLCQFWEVLYISKEDKKCKQLNHVGWENLDHNYFSIEMGEQQNGKKEQHQQWHK